MRLNLTARRPPCKPPHRVNPRIPGLVDALRANTYIQAVTFFQYWIRLAIYTEITMTAQSTRVRSIVPGTRRFRLVEHIHTLSSTGVTERPAPLVRLEGPDISLSGRQILLKTLH